MNYFTKAALITLLLLLSFSANVYSQNDTIARTDSALLKQVEQQMKNSEPSPQPVQVRTAPSTLPDISVIGDFQASYRNNVKRNFNAGINEAELSLQSVVDPYARADFFFTFGKFRSALGRINPVHPHALPFISLPDAYVNYFGDGINDEGVSLSWLIPNSLFYQELVVQFTDGPIDNPSFSRSVGNTYFELAHLKNFFDLSANATLELGLSGLTGANFYNLRTNIAALDLTYKWKPVQFNTYKSFTWQSEAYFSNANISKDTVVNSFGMYSFINFQFSKRLFFTGMY